MSESTFVKQLRPDSLYSGGSGPNPFLGPPTSDDPCNNAAVTKPNDYTGGTELSQAKQALAVSGALNGTSITKVDSVTFHSMKLAARELATLHQVNDPAQLDRIWKYVFSPKARLELDTYAKLSNLRGEFTLTVQAATEHRRASLQLDLSTLSITRLVDLLEGHIIPQLNSKTAELRQLL